MSSTAPTIDDILTAHFTTALDGVTGIRRKRLEFIDQHLRSYLEAEGERVLVTRDLELLAREREFGTTDAFVRTMHANDLLFALSGWVSEEQQLPEPALLRVQLSTAQKLVTTIMQQQLANYEEVVCPLLDIQRDIKEGRALLRKPR